MFNSNKIEAFYKWISSHCPRFVDWVIVIAVFLFIISVIYVGGWVVKAILGWHLLTVSILILIIVIIIWATLTHSHFSGGIKQWWGDRPWKK